MISIIGGAGFIGTNIINKLGLKYDFKIFDNGYNDAGHIDFKRLEIGTGNYKKIVKALKGTNIIINLAGHTRVLESIENPSLSFDYNVKGFFDLLMAAKELGVKKIINASSGGAIIGDVKPPIDEQFLPNPISPYGASKLCNEAFSSAFNASFGMEIVNLRFSNVYGEFCAQKQSAVAKFLKQAINGQKITVFGDGEQTRDFLYVGDLVDAVENCLNIDDISGVFQLGSGHPTSVNHLLEIISRQTNKNLNIRFENANTGEVLENYANINKASKTLNWRPKTRLDVGVKITHDYLCRNYSNR